MIRIAIPANGTDLSSEASEHFGRAPYFIVVDVEEGKVVGVSTVKNPTLERHVHGEVPQLMAKLRVKVVACKGIGPRALRALEELGIETLIADPNLRTVKEVLNEALKHLGITA